MSGLDVATARLVPIAGFPSGWLARVAHAVLFSADYGEEQLAELLDACEGATSSSEVLGRVVALLSTTTSAKRPPFALVTTAGDNVVVLVYGDQTVSLEDAAGDRTDLSSGSGTWLTRSVPDAVRISLGSGQADAAGPTNLRAGVIPAAGALLVAPAPPVVVEVAPPEPASTSVAAETAATAAPIESATEAPPVELPDAEIAAAAALAAPAPEVHLFDAAEEGVLEPAPVEPELPPAEPEPELAAPEPEPELPPVEPEPELPVPEPEPAPVVVAPEEAPAFAATSFEPHDTIPPGVVAGPVVTGRFCGRQHFNDPRDHFCRICGLPLNPETTPEVQAERPPLGVLVWDSGDSDPVSGDLIVGRDPSGDPEVSSGTVNGLTPSGHSEGMSRVHAELRLVGWDVTLADRGSTNGTFVWEEEHQTWHRLEVGERATVKVGAIIAFGERTATFELPNS